MVLRGRERVKMDGWEEKDRFVFLGCLSGFSSFLGEPVQIALTLDIASISSVSESNMVRVVLLSLSLCLMRIYFLPTTKRKRQPSSG